MVFSPTNDAVGVLYIPEATEKPNENFCVKWNGTWYCVHNGRYVDLRQNGNEVVINHCRLNSNGQPVWESRSFYIRDHYPRLIDIKRTPDLSPSDQHYCGDYRQPYKNLISPGTCVGVAYGPKVNHLQDMKNGRYLFWEDKPPKTQAYHCVIHQDEPLLYKVFYSHFPKPKAGVRPELVAKIDSRINVKLVFETPTTICPRRNCTLG